MKKMWTVIIALILIVLLLLLGFFLFRGEKGTGTTTKSKNDSASALAQYDKKTVDVSSADESLTGHIYTTVEGSSLKAVYNLKISYEFPSSQAVAERLSGSPSYYTLVGDLVEQDDLGGAEGTVSAVYCNKNKDFADITGTSGKPFDDCPDEMRMAENRKETSVFTASFSQSYSSYDELLAANVFNVYDGAPFWEREDASTMFVNDDKAAQEGQKLAAFTLLFE